MCTRSTGNGRGASKARHRPRRFENGFTLIELMVTITIMVILSRFVVINMERALLRAKVNTAAVQVKLLQKVVATYVVDTGQLPPTCDETCTAATDPFLNSLGVPGWNGPYMTLYNKKHPWGGHLSFRILDVDGDGKDDALIQLNDDRPGSNSSDNGGPIPSAALTQIDKILDDGKLTTGNARGDGLGFSTPVGELNLIYAFGR